MAGKAAKELTKDEPKRARDVIGGLAGELSTADMHKARLAYNQYRADAPDEPLLFADWVRKFYK